MASGAKFSQIGADVRTASDQELLFDSEWPTMHVLQGGFIEKTVTGMTAIYNHNLNFVPAFIPYTFDPISGQFEIFRATLAIDKKSIYYLPPGGSSNSIDIQFGVLIYNIDLEKNYQAPSNNPSPKIQGGSSVQYGIKFAKEGKNIRSRSMQDFKVNTSARSPLIHAVSHGLGTSLGSTSVLRNYSYTHDLPYNPMFLPYIEYPFLGTRGLYVLIANFAGVTTSGKTITLTNLNQDYNASIIILKDPFDVSENVTEVVI